MKEQELIQRILGITAECASNASPFRRGVAVCFRDPIEPGLSTSSSEILDFFSYGLTNEDLEETASRLSNGMRLVGDRFLESYRSGRCYYFPVNRGFDFPKFMEPSKRRFMKPRGWTHGDAFVVPFWQARKMIGQIVLDDPDNGLIPCDTSRLLLEEIAAFASIALRDAYELQELNQEHGLLRFFTDHAMTGLLVVQGQSIRYANDQMVNILGYDKDYLTRLTPWWNFFHPDDRPLTWDVEPPSQGSKEGIRAIRKDGRVVWLTMIIHSVLYREGEVSAFQFYDVTDRTKVEELLKEKALRDPLTGFRNRGFFDDAIQLELQRSKRYRRTFTLVMADLANFKQVNDQLGHQEGDRILVGIADIIREELRESDWVVRYGGDEFLLVLPETGSSLDSLIARLTQSVDTWCLENCASIPVGIDLGWATWTSEDPKAIPDLVGAADVQLYKQKAKRKALEKGFG